MKKGIHPEYAVTQVSCACGSTFETRSTKKTIKEELNRDEPSLLLCTNSPCIMLRREKRTFSAPLYTVTDACRGCRMCLEINCPAISWQGGAGTTKDGHKRKGTAFINKDQCVGCAVCAQICKSEAIVPGTK